MAEGRQGQDSAALQDVTLLRVIDKMLSKCGKDPEAAAELFKWAAGWTIGVQGDRSRQMIFQSIQEQTLYNSLLTVEDVPSRIIVGTNTTADPKHTKTEIDSIRGHLEKILAVGDTGERSLTCRPIAELLHDCVPNVAECLTKPSSARMADAVMNYQGDGQPPPDLLNTTALERLYLIEIFVPFINVAEALREQIEKHPRVHRDDDDEDDLVLRRRERHYTAEDSNFTTFVRVVEDNLMGKIRRQAGLSFLKALDPRQTDPKKGMTILSCYLRAIAKALKHCDNPASQDVATITDNGFFGRRTVNLRNLFSQADALDFLSICTSVTGQIHEKRKGNTLSLVFGVRTKANGKKADQSSYQMVIGSLKKTWKLLCRIRTNTTSLQDMDRLQRELPRFLHRLILVDICSREINGLEVDLAEYLVNFQKIWQSEKLEDYINRRLAILDGSHLPKSPQEQITRPYPAAWDDLGRLVRRRLRKGPRVDIPNIHLKIDISESILSSDDVRESPIGPPPVKEYKTSYMQFVTVNRLEPGRESTATPLMTETATIHLREIPILVKPRQSRQLLLSRDASQPVLSVRVLTSQAVLREVTQSNDELVQGPYRAGVTLVYDEIAKGATQPGFVPEANLYTLVQTLLFYFVLEVLARRQDRLDDAATPTPLLIIRLSTTSATIGADGVEDDGLAEADPDAGLSESKHDALIRSQFHTMTFALSSARRVLHHGYCITAEPASRFDKNLDQRPKRLEVAAYAALRYLPSTVDFGSLPLGIDKLMVFILTSAKSRGIAGVNQPEDEYVLHGEIWTLVKDPKSNSFRVELHKKFTDVVLHKHRFTEIGDGFGVIQELHDQHDYQHCIFLSRTPYSDRFGLTRGSNPYYCNNTILSTMKRSMPGLKVYPLLTDVISGVRDMPNEKAKKVAGLYRILDWHPVVSPEPPEEIEQDASILNFMLVGTYSLLRKSDDDFSHSRSVSYNVPLTAVSVYHDTIKDMLKPGPLKATLANAISALHLVLAERPPSPELPATAQWAAKEQAVRFVLMPYESMIGTSGESIRKHGEIWLNQKRKWFRVQSLGLLHICRDIMDKVQTAPPARKRGVPPAVPREPRA